MVIMRRYALNILTVFLLLILTICDTALAEERQVYAAQGDVAFFKENDKIGLQSTDGTVLHAAEFDGTGYFDATGHAMRLRPFQRIAPRKPCRHMSCWYPGTALTGKRSCS